MKQLTLDNSQVCLHIWEQYTAQPEEEDPPKWICRRCGLTTEKPTMRRRT